MADIGQLRIIAGLLGSKSSFNAIIAKALCDGMVSEYGDRIFCYSLPSDGPIVGKHVVPYLEGFSLEGVEMDILMFAQDMPPHRHHTSDGVLMIRGIDRQVPPGWEIYLPTGEWGALVDGEVIVLPRGTPHGFHRLPGAGPLYAISVNYPPLPIKDIQFL